MKNRTTDEANHNARPVEQILSEFRVARERLLKRVDELDASLFARAIPHPRLKTPLRLVDHLYFVADHDDHHLARIWELAARREQSVRDLVAGNANESPRTFSLAQLARELYQTLMESERVAKERTWPQLG